ncbi:MAG: hypothetical protein PHE93_04675 [Clostridia bacterium]|nr:hypothetical protein [Clostridia bacterium]
MDNIDMLINELESEVLRAKKSAFSANSVLIDKMIILDLISRLRSTLPAVIKEASAIKRDRDSIVQQADEYAKKVIESAKVDADRIVSETEIMTRATEDSKTMLEEADANYRKMDYDARFCAYKILDESEKVLRESITQITDNKRKLANE